MTASSRDAAPKLRASAVIVFVTVGRILLSTSRLTLLFLDDCLQVDQRPELDQLRFNANEQLFEGRLIYLSVEIASETDRRSCGVTSAICIFGEDVTHYGVEP
jgi:hypothetical protein